jgi:protein subunit release factor B
MPEEYTSTAKQKKQKARMVTLGVLEGDLTEKFILGSGSGGQKVNKTASCVYLRHGPSGIEVKCQKARSRAMNRFYARRELCDQLEEKILGEKSKRRMAAEKIRRQKRRRSRRQKEKMLDGKRKQAQKKELRRPVKRDGD